MKRLSNSGLNIDAPSAGYSEGQVRDNPGDDSGTGAVKGWLQDTIYFPYALIKKYLPGGVASDTLESETNSDGRDAIEYMVGIKNPNAAEWDNGTTYAQDDHVMRLGVQYVSMVASNTGNDPFSNLDKWLPCFSRDDAFIKWQKGDDIPGGFDILHNYRDAGYRQVFDWGKYNVGGDTGGSGKNFEAYGVHLDGTQVTGNATLEAIFDVGGPDEYHLLDVIAPDNAGTRTLLDARGRVGRSVDAVAGDTENVGVVQEDQFQGHVYYNGAGTGAAAAGIYGSTTTDVPGVATNTLGSSVAVPSYQQITSSPKSNGVDGTPRTGDETRVKAYTTGVPSVLVMLEV
jgi:hypothetical protein